MVACNRQLQLHCVKRLKTPRSLSLRPTPNPPPLQWTSHAHADSTGVQLKTLQSVVGRLMRGEISAVETNWKQQLVFNKRVRVKAKRWKAALPHMFVCKYIHPCTCTRRTVNMYTAGPQASILCNDSTALAGQFCSLSLPLTYVYLPSCSPAFAHRAGIDFASMPQPTAGPLPQDLIPQELDRRGSFMNAYGASFLELLYTEDAEGQSPSSQLSTPSAAEGGDGGGEYATEEKGEPLPLLGLPPTAVPPTVQIRRGTSRHNFAMAQQQQQQLFQEKGTAIESRGTDANAGATVDGNDTAVATSSTATKTTNTDTIDTASPNASSLLAPSTLPSSLPRTAMATTNDGTSSARDRLAKTVRRMSAVNKAKAKFLEASKGAGSDHRQRAGSSAPQWQHHVKLWLNKATESIPAYIERSTL